MAWLTRTRWPGTLAFLLSLGLVLSLALGAKPIHAEDFLTLQARLYDRGYGDFGGEFEAETVDHCTYDIHKWSTGMVADTLTFDPLAGKKIPRRGRSNVCSDHLEKWFNPANTRGNACGNLFLQNVGTAERPLWKFQDSTFFPMDEKSPQTPWTTPKGVTYANDFAYCMEINASMVYRGGETLQFQGDDDLWVYIDNKLAFDMGGVHVAMENAKLLDTLPILKGKQGKALDLDIYFCSRQPTTSVFGMQTTLELKPATLKSLHIVDTLGNTLTGKDIISGRTRVCARPYYQLPGEDQCGNYKIPKGLSFLSADWDLNGRVLSLDGGQACMVLDPADFPDNTRLHLTAKSGLQSARVSLTLVRAARPLQGMALGHGKLESLSLRLDSAGGQAPDGLEVSFPFQGQSRKGMVYPGAVNRASPAQGGGPSNPFDPFHLFGVLEAQQQGPWGGTEFSPIEAMTVQTLGGQPVTRRLWLRDGISPVLTKAALHWGSHAAVSQEQCSGFPAYLDLETSETLASGGLVLGLFLAKFKSGGEVDLAAQGAQCLVTQTHKRRLLIPEAMAARFQNGDSLTLGENALDRAGNAARQRYIAVEIPAAYTGGVGAMRLQENPAVGKAFEARPGKHYLLPVTMNKSPVKASADKAHIALASGPVFALPLRVPIASIRLRFFDHLGGFVQAASYDFSPEEWDGIRLAGRAARSEASVSIPSETPFGDTLWLRLMWYPVSHEGRKLATGVYIVQGEGYTQDGALVQIGGQTWRNRASRFRLEPLRFGYIRD